MLGPRRPLIGIVAALCSAAPSLMAHQPHDPIGAIAVSPNYAQDGTVLAATAALSLKIDAYLLLKSTDGGVTWSPVNGLDQNNPIVTIVFSPAYSQDQTIYVAGNGGLFRTTNQGTSWKQLSAKKLLSVALSPNFAVDNTLFAVTNGKAILESTNRGNAFTELPAPAPLTSNLSAAAVSPNFTADHTLLLGSQANGIFESTNGGSSWTSVTAGMTLPSIAAVAFSPNFATDRTAFAGTLGSGVLRSTNGGSSWTASNTGIPDLNVSSLTFSPGYAQNSRLWITTGAAGVFESSNSGASWTLFATVTRALSGQSPIHYQAVTAATGTSGTVLYLAMYEGLWTAASSAFSWQYIDTIPTRLVRYINMSPNYVNDQTLFGNTYGGGNLWSTNGGAAWTFQNTGMQSAYTDAGGISPNFAADNTAFSSMGTGLQRTTDRGATWQLMVALNAETYPRALAVSPNFAQDSTVLIGTDNEPGSFYPPTVTYDGGQYPNQGLFLSYDGGNNWIPTSLGGPAIVSITLSPGFASDLTGFAVSPDSGLYKSTNGGMTWSSIVLPVSSQEMAQVTVSPNFTNDQTVFVSAIAGGLLKSVDGGSTWTLLSNTSGLRFLDVEISPNFAKDQTILAGTVQSGLLRSSNAGTSFAQVPAFPDSFVTAVGISPNYAKDGTLFAAGYRGVYKSTNRGSTWTYTEEPARIEDGRTVTSITDQQPPTITYQGNWTQATPEPLASSNSYTITSEYQDTATLQFMGTGVRWLSWTGPGQGSASVQLDGVTEGSVSLLGTTDLYQQNVWEQHGISCGNHAFTVTALPQAGQTVSVDAFDIWIDTCPFFNLSNIH
jgi:photosystem II stability/assembly factor-like uncharacterized protein